MKFSTINQYKNNFLYFVQKHLIFIIKSIFVQIIHLFERLIRYAIRKLVCLLFVYVGMSSFIIVCFYVCVLVFQFLPLVALIQVACDWLVPYFTVVNLVYPGKFTLPRQLTLPRHIMPHLRKNSLR